MNNKKAGYDYDRTESLEAPGGCCMHFGMTQTEQIILDALLELERVVEAMPRSNPKPDLRPMFSRLDELTASLPVSAEPLLLHYLHKKSYEKARLFLQGREAENLRGNCHGHVDEHGHAWKPGGTSSSR